MKVPASLQPLHPNIAGVRRYCHHLGTGAATPRIANINLLLQLQFHGSTIPLSTVTLHKGSALALPDVRLRIDYNHSVTLVGEVLHRPVNLARKNILESRLALRAAKSDAILDDVHRLTIPFLD